MYTPSYDLLKELQFYSNSTLITPEEQAFLDECITFLASQPFCFERSCKGHFTGSAWVVNHELTHVLLTHHRKLNKWLQLGGHAEGDAHIQRVALREAHEESGTDRIKLLIPTIFDIDIHPIPSACDRHYDIIYLMQAQKNAEIAISEESNDLAWIKLEDVPRYTQEPSMLRKLKKIVTHAYR